MDPFNRDLTQQGYDDGINNAKDRKPKDARGVVRHAKTWIWGDDAINSYTQAYNQGYAAGLALNHDVYYPKNAIKHTTATQGEPAMSQATSFAGQIEILEDLKSYLNSFQERLLGVAGS